MLPLQVPGGPELLVVALIILILAVIVAALVSLFKRVSTTVSGKQRRTQELETRVVELEENFESEGR